MSERLAFIAAMAAASLGMSVYSPVDRPRRYTEPDEAELKRREEARINRQRAREAEQLRREEEAAKEAARPKSRQERRALARKEAKRNRPRCFQKAEARHD